MIQPIDDDQQQQVERTTTHYLKLAEESYNLSIAPIPIRFDLIGRAAGIYCVRGKQRYIRYNPYLFAKYFEDSLINTVPHEVAHYVIDLIYGVRRVRPHGKEWRAIVKSLGSTPRTTGTYNLEGIPTRRQRRFTYDCNCTNHQLSSCRHNRIRQGRTTYHCRHCNSALTFVG